MGGQPGSGRHSSPQAQIDMRVSLPYSGQKRREGQGNRGGGEGGGEGGQGME